MRRSKSIPPWLVLLFLTLTTVVADEPTVRSDLSIANVASYVDELAKKQQIVTDLKVRIEQGVSFFEITSTNDPSTKPWLIQFNLSESEFKAQAKKHETDGFAMPVHRFVTVNRKRLHSAVWIQDSDRGIVLTLPDGDLPQSGHIGSEIEPLKKLMSEFLKANNIPGGTLAVSHNGKMIFERGFGYSEVDSRTPMPATANMRIASLSKPITAVAILILVQDGKLQLDQKLIDLLKRHSQHQFDFSKIKEVDPRWAQITVRHLLQHSGGWDRAISQDTVFRSVKVSKTLQLDRLARPHDLVQYQLAQPLDFDPGTKYVYSNVGYCMLGRVIEAVTGQPYEEFVSDRILQPAGMIQTRLGKTRLCNRAADEVRYYTQKTFKGPAVWDLAADKNDGGFEMVSECYGQWDLEVMDSHGGWTSTAPDLVRFIDAIDSPEAPLLTKESREMMLERPSFLEASSTDTWYGLGWSVRIVDRSEGRNLWHTGSFAGTSSLMVRRSDGYTWAVLFNVDRTKNGNRCSDLIDRKVHSAVNESQVSR